MVYMLFDTCGIAICASEYTYGRLTRAGQDNRTSTDTEYWTDVNGVSGFDIVRGTSHYRYVEGHIVGSQLYLYAQYINIIDDELLFE